MDTSPPAPLPSATRGVWERRARWLLPIGCLGIAVIVAAVGFAVASFIYSTIRSSDPIQLALAAANADQRVIGALGSPITDCLFVTGSFNTSGPSGRAEFALPVNGPRGNATIFAQASKSMGRWNLEVLILDVAKTRERIDLLHEPAVSPTPAATATPNQAMQRTAPRSDA